MSLSPRAVEILRSEAASWLGTPFRARAAVKGAGVDCVCLAGELMVAVGALDTYEYPARYSLDWAQHHAESLILRWLDARPDAFASLAADAPPEPGDVVCFRLGRCVHHCGVSLDASRFVHAWEHASGVSLGNLQDPTWARRLAALYRPLKSC